MGAFHARDPPEAGHLGRALHRFGRKLWQVDNRLRKILVEGDVPVGIVFPGERVEAEGVQFVEGSQTQLGCLGIALVAEGGEHVLVLFVR